MSAEYPEYILKPYSGLLIQKRDGKETLKVYKWDEYYFDDSYKFDLLGKYDIKDNHNIMLISMPLGDNGKDIRELYSENSINIDMIFYKNVAQYLLDFINEYNLYLLDIKLKNMVTINGKIKFIDLDFVCKVKDNINDKNVNNLAKYNYNTIPDCNALKERIGDHMYTYMAPEIRKQEWNINPETTLTWNIGYMIYTDLIVIYKRYQHIHKRGKLHKTTSNRQFMIQTLVLIDPELATLCSHNEKERDLFRAKQLLLERIIPLPGSSDETWMTGEIYKNWNPNIRVPLSMLVQALVNALKTAYNNVSPLS